VTENKRMQSKAELDTSESATLINPPTRWKRSALCLKLIVYYLEGLLLITCVVTVTSSSFIHRVLKIPPLITDKEFINQTVSRLNIH
jgi:hypothetical protein